MFVSEYFLLNDEAVDTINSMTPQFGYDGFGEFVFYRTYSRLKANGRNESWADCVIRVINGTFTIRKDWYVKNHIPWDEDYWQLYATDMAISMFKMEWMPPGRGLWAMGTPFVYERGSMALNNCAFTYFTSDDLADDAAWFMDCLMLGVGVGFDATPAKFKVFNPTGYFKYIIPDSREGWVNSVRLLILAYTVPGVKLPHFIYDEVRLAGLPIKGFGGLTSGPEPLKELHRQIQICFSRYMNEIGYTAVRLKADIGNLIGCCVVAGNVRRSAELLMIDVTDPVGLDLKDYSKNPDRENYGWMSNNSVKLHSDEHYEMLGEVARRVLINGEPGIANLKNFPFGRLGHNDGLKSDRARGLNPCGEICLEHRELCNVSETCPTRCVSADNPNRLDSRVWLKACEYAAAYSSTVSLLPTHQPSTNCVVARNRRIGVGIIDYTGWRVQESQHKVIKYLREGYNVIRETNRRLNSEAGVPEAIKVTTIKPGGTVPKLVGRTAGIGYPTFAETLRTVRVKNDHPVSAILNRAGVPNEPEKHDPNHTSVYGFPILQGPAKPAGEVSLWEQASNLITVQREWSDNAVSNTLYFRPKWKLVKVLTPDETKISSLQGAFCWLQDNTNFKVSTIERLLKLTVLELENGKYKLVVKTGFDGRIETIKVFEFDPRHEEDNIEFVLSSTVPHIKSLSLLPHTDQGVFAQMPEQHLSKKDFDTLRAKIQPIDWSVLTGSDGEDERYCSGPACEVVLS